MLNTRIVLLSLCLFSSLFAWGADMVDKPRELRKDILKKGEFNYRMEMTLKRLTGKAVSPVFTDEFVLADVNIDLKNPRRFHNFSGDLSGRFIEVLSLVKDHPEINVKPLVAKLISFQKADGRFGDSGLEFSEKAIGSQHMALLWGNGRLLVGLMEYYKNFKDPKALKAAEKLGDFFIRSYEACATPAIVKKMEGFGATGIICFTQYIEGLVMLSESTGNAKYATVAEKTYKVLPKRGIQHSHGYLTTLRGVLNLYNYNKDKASLDFVKQAFDDLVTSADYTLFGSVTEYFGAKKERDEGCSTADFLRLSLGLYQATSDVSYLEKAEFCLLNAFYFNQYYTGDFGHHFISNTGARPDYLHTAWWCCTMHGLRAMYDVKDNYLLSYKKGVKQVDLFLETDFVDPNIHLSMRNGGYKDNYHFYKFAVNKWESSDLLSFRVPSWATAPKVFVNGKEVAWDDDKGYLSIKAKPKKGDVINVAFKYALRVRAEKNFVSLDQLKVPVKGNLMYGPYLLGVDDRLDPTFIAEPNSNTVYSKTVSNAYSTYKGSANSANYFTALYKHAGYPSHLKTIFRPISEMAFDKRGYLLFTMLFSPDDTVTYQQDKSMTEPWSQN
ncbi:MAG: hypothetical protein EON51_01655 [Acinetobacter sp.]|nr:MAG: hypothetical protein EON51_01655 [Acinetobacter sp.]